MNNLIPLEDLAFLNAWIPVTKRLPDYGDEILVTALMGQARVVDVDEYSVERGFESYGDYVIAWMPYPIPYKGDVDEI